jgi:hypothetical protein
MPCKPCILHPVSNSAFTLAADEFRALELASIHKTCRRHGHGLVHHIGAEGAPVYQGAGTADHSEGYPTRDQLLGVTATGHPASAQTG